MENCPKCKSKLQLGRAYTVRDGKGQRKVQPHICPVCGYTDEYESDNQYGGSEYQPEPGRYGDLGMGGSF